MKKAMICLNKMLEVVHNIYLPICFMISYYILFDY